MTLFQLLKRCGADPAQTEQYWIEMLQPQYLSDRMVWVEQCAYYEDHKFRLVVRQWHLLLLQSLGAILSKYCNKSLYTFQ